MNAKAFKKAFWDKVGNFDQILPLLDSLHDTAFFFKDLESRHTMNNQRAVASARVASEAETIGKVGDEFWYSDRVALYRKQDQEVMRTGKAIINAMCPTPEIGSNTAIIYSKIPLRDKEGKIVGLAGVWRETDSMSSMPHSYSKLAGIAEYLHSQFAEPITVEELAARVGLSRSQFNRLFRKLFGLSPYDYLKSLRISAASKLLRETDLKTTEVALLTGFYDHSHFSKVFKDLMELTPRAYRKMHSV
ncbi:helix-turn-helix domain-containing protein [Pelagicoccus mobilis]|uniref:Helix-turn-helix domain-containing protein n=1 Tax=Pelagicoccus mobilis TaxID=415221 RepID=A0A934S474_9BACT|nr:helix-turn-helix domain-containing protein [Pelagicoccus mobilis]MBK1879069.1 helix-turn-helix domain-containing protein [Pelagicoccus mobilis]